MPFGLTNAPAAWQQFINDVLIDLIDIHIIVYLDDILIYLDNLDSHWEHIWEILQQLWKHKLFANATKCKWSVDTVKYLGYIMSPSGLTMASEKVKAIVNWPMPWKVRDIQSFLGFANSN